MLPKIDVPIYDLKLLSTGKKIRFRPFTVKEEKLFLMATESSDIKSITDTIKQVVNNCVLDKINVDELPIFDLEQIFLQLRSKSIGEIINLKYRCQNEIDTEDKKDKKKCNTVVDIDVNISDITPKFNSEISNKIELTENVGVVMKYPGINILENYDKEDETTSTLSTIINCIDYIYDKESMYYAKDSTKEELMEFVESLQTKDLQKFKEFFESVPKLQKNVKFKCPKCKHEEDILVEGIESFFV